MHHLPLVEDPTEGSAIQKRVLGVTADGAMWLDHLVQYAQVLLSQPKHTQSSQPFSPEQRQAWDRWDIRVSLGCGEQDRTVHSNVVITANSGFYNVNFGVAACSSLWQT